MNECGPFPGVDRVHGVTYDGQNVWFAAGDKLNALDPASGKTLRSLEVAAHVGTAFDGQHLFQIAEDRIQKIDPQTGRVLSTIPAPGGGADSGLAWAEGTLWVGQYRERKIHQIDPETGAILRAIESNRFVTGVTWVGQEFWHATWEDDESDLRRVDPRTGEVLETLELPPGEAKNGPTTQARPRGRQWIPDSRRLHEQVIEAASRASCDTSLSRSSRRVHQIIRSASRRAAFSPREIEAPAAPACRDDGLVRPPLPALCLG